MLKVLTRVAQLFIRVTFKQILYRFVFQDYLESEGFLSKEEAYTLDVLYNTLNQQMQNMDGIAYLQSSPTEVYERAIHRNTAADKLLDIEYLTAIDERYNNLISNITNYPVLKVPESLPKHETAEIVANWTKSFLEF